MQQGTFSQISDRRFQQGQIQGPLPQLPAEEKLQVCKNVHQTLNYSSGLFDKEKNLCGREWNEYIVLKGNCKSKGVHKWIYCRTVTVNDCVHLSACCISTVSILSLITTNTCTWSPQPKDRRTRRSSVPASAQCLLLRVGGERENMNF